jgi:two-component system, chemotaxis family, sensor kinase CheA
VELSDRGPGIDWESIRARATEFGIPHSTQADLEEALFADGVSARSDVTEISGRGIGLSAVRAACRKRRGTVHVTTRRGKGTSFRFSFPVSQFQSLVQLEAGAR